MRRKRARVHVVVTNRETIRPVAVALALARELRERYPTSSGRNDPELLVNRSMMWAFLRESRSPAQAWAEQERTAS